MPVLLRILELFGVGKEVHRRREVEEIEDVDQAVSQVVFFGLVDLRRGARPLLFQGLAWVGHWF